MPEKKQGKKLEYKDKDGNTLYGFSQTQLERTNARLNSVVLGLKILIILLVILVVGVGLFLGWIAKNDVVTRIIYGF